MIMVKNKVALQKMEQAGQLLASIFAEIPNQIQAGTSTLSLDSWIAHQLARKGLESKAKGYRGYRFVSCISVNDEVVHGVPSATKILNDGDVVKVDVCASWKGYCADMARPFFVGTPDDSVVRLQDAAFYALNKGIEQVIVGNRLSDISAAIQHEIERYGYGIVREFAGHGIGRQMHEEPEILNYGKPGRGPLLQPGMAFALEPMITMNSHKIYIADDGWTVKTVDGSMAAHVEDTVIVTEKGPKILTRMQN